MSLEAYFLQVVARDGGGLRTFEMAPFLRAAHEAEGGCGA
jgi:hypothetical protein